MLRCLPIAAAIFGFTMPPLAGADQAAGDDAQAVYQQAQALKRSNRFNEARIGFQEATTLAGPASKWSALAADELHYGLPLHESNVLLAQLVRAADHPTRARLLARVEALYQEMLEANADNPERIAEIERKRDQLALLRQAAQGSEHSSLTDGLARLRGRLEQLYARQGRFPDRRQIETEVANMLSEAGLAPARLTLFDFYPSSTSFFATLRDSQGGADVKIKGDGSGIRIEGGGL